MGNPLAWHPSPSTSNLCDIPSISLTSLHCLPEPYYSLTHSSSSSFEHYLPELPLPALQPCETSCCCLECDPYLCTYPPSGALPHLPLFPTATPSFPILLPPHYSKPSYSYPTSYLSLSSSSLSPPSSSSSHFSGHSMGFEARPRSRLPMPVHHGPSRIGELDNKPTMCVRATKRLGVNVMPLPRSKSFHQLLRSTQNGQILASKGTIRGTNGETFTPGVKPLGGGNARNFLVNHPSSSSTHKASPGSHRNVSNGEVINVVSPRMALPNTNSGNNINHNITNQNNNINATQVKCLNNTFSKRTVPNSIQNALEKANQQSVPLGASPSPARRSGLAVFGLQKRQAANENSTVIVNNNNNNSNRKTATSMPVVNNNSSNYSNINNGINYSNINNNSHNNVIGGGGSSNNGPNHNNNNHQPRLKANSGKHGQSYGVNQVANAVTASSAANANNGVSGNHNKSSNLTSNEVTTKLPQVSKYLTGQIGDRVSGSARESLHSSDTHLSCTSPPQTSSSAGSTSSALMTTGVTDRTSSSSSQHHPAARSQPQYSSNISTQHLASGNIGNSPTSAHTHHHPAGHQRDSSSKSRPTQVALFVPLQMPRKSRITSQHGNNSSVNTSSPSSFSPTSSSSSLSSTLSPTFISSSVTITPSRCLPKSASSVSTTATKSVASSHLPASPVVSQAQHYSEQFGSGGVTSISGRLPQKRISQQQQRHSPVNNGVSPTISPTTANTATQPSHYSSSAYSSTSSFITFSPAVPVLSTFSTFSTNSASSSSPTTSSESPCKSSASGGNAVVNVHHPGVRSSFAARSAQHSGRNNVQTKILSDRIIGLSAPDLAAVGQQTLPANESQDKKCQQQQQPIQQSSQQQRPAVQQANQNNRTKIKRSVSSFDSGTYMASRFHNNNQTPVSRHLLNTAGNNSRNNVNFANNNNNINAKLSSHSQSVSKTSTATGNTPKTLPTKTPSSLSSLSETNSFRNTTKNESPWKLRRPKPSFSGGQEGGATTASQYMSFEFLNERITSRLQSEFDYYAGQLRQFGTLTGGGGEDATCTQGESDNDCLTSKLSSSASISSSSTKTTKAFQHHRERSASLTGGGSVGTNSLTNSSADDDNDSTSARSDDSGQVSSGGTDRCKAPKLGKKKSFRKLLENYFVGSSSNGELLGSSSSSSSSQSNPDSCMRSSSKISLLGNGGYRRQTEHLFGKSKENFLLKRTTPNAGLKESLKRPNRLVTAGFGPSVVTSVHTVTNRQLEIFENILRQTLMANSVKDDKETVKNFGLVSSSKFILEDQKKNRENSVQADSAFESVDGDEEEEEEEGEKNYENYECDSVLGLEDILALESPMSSRRSSVEGFEIDVENELQDYRCFWVPLNDLTESDVEGGDESLLKLSLTSKQLVSNKFLEQNGLDGLIKLAQQQQQKHQQQQSGSNGENGDDGQLPPLPNAAFFTLSNQLKTLLYNSSRWRSSNVYYNY